MLLDCLYGKIGLPPIFPNIYIVGWRYLYATLPSAQYRTGPMLQDCSTGKMGLRPIFPRIVGRCYLYATLPRPIYRTGPPYRTGRCYLYATLPCPPDRTGPILLECWKMANSTGGWSTRQWQPCFWVVPREPCRMPPLTSTVSTVQDRLCGTGPGKDRNRRESTRLCFWGFASCRD